MNILSELFIAFFKIGLFTFGGGYAMLPLIEREIVEKRKYATSEEIMDYFAIGQCTPGVIAVNTATFIGYKKRGFLGAVVATVGVILPSIIIISVIAMFVSKFYEYEIVSYILGGIRVAVSVLIVNAVYSMAKKSIKDIWCVILALFSFISFLLFNISPVVCVFIGAVSGMLISYFKAKKGGNTR